MNSRHTLFGALLICAGTVMLMGCSKPEAPATPPAPPPQNAVAPANDGYRALAEQKQREAQQQGTK